MNLLQVHRLLKLIGLLQVGKGYNAETLAVECEVSRRTIFRDLETLRQLGYDVHYDEGTQGFRIAGARYLPPMDFTTEEALALIVLSRELGQGSGLAFLGAARSASAKLESRLPLALREEVKDLVGALEIRSGPTNLLEGRGDVYQQLLVAVKNRTCVRIRYGSLAERQVICTRVSPYRLVFIRRSWYVIGRSALHRAVRTFNLSRIENLEPLSDTFSVPRGFSLKRYFRNAWHLIPEPGPDREVVIRFAPMVAKNVAEVTWHRTQRIEFQADGSLLFRATISGLMEIAWWILGYADQALVLAPPELRQLVAERAAKAGSQYAEPKQRIHGIPAPNAWTRPAAGNTAAAANRLQ